ncbi:hypothetical protein [Vulcanococcus sp. Clear-D1]|uniref:hypothetical protein n=1 Tax=Vulcanococcus sp. Clear-D1 TaxID=2766970 RepID=UPI00199B3532|nr:hypothetical protein [Vulcanococcus sp. Clear-D1]MBD1194456.1 hypothetical protein [Vulcanococcus sp. Clear-D1]MBD1194457.1 hypothetical protein [Vulcanococcus sp. Clear-D1]
MIKEFFELICQNQELRNELSENPSSWIEVAQRYGISLTESDLTFPNLIEIDGDPRVVIDNMPDSCTWEGDWCCVIVGCQSFCLREDLIKTLVRECDLYQNDKLSGRIEDSLPQGSSGEESVSVRVWGLGAMLCVYQLDEEKFVRFLQLSEEGELDHEDLEVGTDYGDQVAPFFEPTVIINGTEINEDVSLESLGAKADEEAVSICTDGLFWAVKVETYKGYWGSIDAPQSLVTDISNYSIHKQHLTIGLGSDSEELELSNISFMDGEYGEFNEHELSGKSIDWYLVNADGEVFSV